MRKYLLHIPIFIYNDIYSLYEQLHANRMLEYSLLHNLYVTCYMLQMYYYEKAKEAKKPLCNL